MSPAEAVVEAVATVDGSASTDLPPLFDALDPDALDRLFAEKNRTSQPTKIVQFSYAGWNVFVRGDGAIRVCDPVRLSERAPTFQKPLGEG